MDTKLAIKAVEALIFAYAKGAERQQIDWGGLDVARELALKAKATGTTAEALERESLRPVVQELVAEALSMHKEVQWTLDPESVDYEKLAAAMTGKGLTVHKKRQQGVYSFYSDLADQLDRVALVDEIDLAALADEVDMSEFGQRIEDRVGEVLREGTFTVEFTK